MLLGQVPVNAGAVWSPPLTLMLGNVTLMLYDVALMRFAAIYIARFRPKLFH